MKDLALTIPGFSPIPNPSGFNPQLTNLGSLLSGVLNILFYVAVFMAFYWLIWAGFQYILSSGKKEDLGKARERIRWAIVGLVVIFAAYFIAKFVSEIFPPQGTGGLPF